MKQKEICKSCSTLLSEENYIENVEQLCNECYDDKYSGCCGGGCCKGE